MDSSKEIEDDTIRDDAEQGYVSTRPRFTRVRRTWPFNIRNLQAEDMRILDEFFMSPSYAARGGNSFLFPNLLDNGSFEFPALSASDIVFGWNVTANSAQESIGITAATVEDGTQAISFATVASQTVAAHTTLTGQVNCDTAIPCTTGETYTFTAALNAIEGTLSAAVLVPQVLISYFDVNGEALSTAPGPVATLGGGWQTYGYQFTVPASAASFTVAFQVSLANSTGSPITLDASASVTIDAAGCALSTPLTPYGRMVGSQSLGCLVRFSKPPKTADIGWGGGVKRYGAQIELTEV